MKRPYFPIVAAFLLFASSFAGAQTADAIIQKHIAAVGGAANWKKVKTLKLIGSTGTDDSKMLITVTTIANKAQKIEYKIKGLTAYQVVTTTKGWVYRPMMGMEKPEPMTDDDLKDNQRLLDIREQFIDYKTKGYAVTLAGKETVNGTMCYILKMASANGNEKTFYMDAKTYYTVSLTDKYTTDGREQSHVSGYSNYKKLPEGIVLPMTVDEGEGPVTYTSAEINKPVDEHIFEPVATKK